MTDRQHVSAIYGRPPEVLRSAIEAIETIANAGNWPEDVGTLIALHSRIVAGKIVLDDQLELVTQHLRLRGYTLDSATSVTVPPGGIVDTDRPGAA